MNKLVTICARGGSKGIPNKNIRLLNEKPLLFYSISLAQKFIQKSGGLLELSTDSEKIKQTAELFDLKTDYFRPKHLGTDNVGKVEVIRDLLEYSEKRYQKKFDIIIDLDVTSPLRTIEDLDSSLRMLQARSDAINLFSVSKAEKNPYFNMIEESENGFCKLVKKGDFYTRQSTPNVFELNASIYIYKREFFERSYKSVITSYSMFYLMDHICFDIDQQIQFDFLEWLILTRKIDFQFYY